MAILDVFGRDLGGIAGALAVASSIRQIETIRPDKAGQPHAKPWRKMGTLRGRIYKPNGPRECALRVRQMQRGA